jgi:hypothetical protein
MDGFNGTWADEDDDEKIEPRLWWGLVTNNQDPSKRGRVKANVPGFTKESTWMEPVGMPGSGGGKHGMWAVPKVGATVLVGFVLGDIDSPIYFSGPPPSGQQQDNNNPDNVVWQSDDFRFSFIEQAGNKRARLETILPNFLPAGLASTTLVAGTFKGLIIRGNIDLTNRPQHTNPDGSISTVRTISFGEDDFEVLIPTIADDGTLLTDDQAIALYHSTGKFFGKFDNSDDADVYSVALHNQQAASLTGPTLADVTSVIEITINAGAGGKSHVINIHAPGGVNMTAQGTINIDAPVVTIKGRTVMPTDEAI